MKDNYLTEFLKAVDWKTTLEAVAATILVFGALTGIAALSSYCPWLSLALMLVALAMFIYILIKSTRNAEKED